MKNVRFIELNTLQSTSNKAFSSVCKYVYFIYFPVCVTPSVHMSYYLLKSFPVDFNVFIAENDDTDPGKLLSYYYEL